MNLFQVAWCREHRRYECVERADHRHRLATAICWYLSYPYRRSGLYSKLDGFAGCAECVERNERTWRETRLSDQYRMIVHPIVQPDVTSELTIYLEAWTHELARLRL